MGELIPFERPKLTPEEQMERRMQEREEAAQRLRLIEAHTSKPADPERVRAMFRPRR